MIVCHCNAISEEALRKAIADGANDFFAYSEKSGIGDDCGTSSTLRTKCLRGS